MGAILTLRLRLLMLWLFTIAVCGALGYIILSVYRSGTEARTERAVATVQQSCGALREHYARSVVGGPEVVDVILMEALLNALLEGKPGVEGGYWHFDKGFVAYAFPTHEGSERKVDVPSTERSRIETLARTSLAAGEMATDLLRGLRETVILVACPVEGHGSNLGAWSMIRLPTTDSKAYDEAIRGLVVLLLFVVLSGVWLGYSFHRWSHHFARIERALRGSCGDGALAIDPANDRELDRVIAALNDFSARLTSAQRRASELHTALERTERFAALGRLAAAVAHEVRNPIAAIRLRTENAIAHPEKLEAALGAVLHEVERVDAILKGLLSQSEPVSVHPRMVDIASWVTKETAVFLDRCAAKQIGFDKDIELATWSFDPRALGRALANLLDNALDHTPAGGRIGLSIAGVHGQSMVVRVRDTGPGVAAAVKARLFEPFVTGRSDGVGLGLALAREIAVAHGGTARYVDQPGGACFELEIPWRAC